MANDEFYDDHDQLDDIEEAQSSERPIRSASDLIAFLEAIAATMIMAFICVFLLVFGLTEVVSRFNLSDIQRAMRWIVWLVIVIGAGWSAKSIGGSIGEAVGPMLPAIAMRYRVPLLLRPFVGGWWIAWAVIVVLLGHALIKHYESFGSTWSGQLVRYSFSTFAMFVCAVATNAYVLIGAWILTHNTWLVRLLWKSRIIVDALVALIAPLFAPSYIPYFDRLVGGH